MLVIGVVGGIASGKSHVAGLLARLGGVVLDADLVGHQILKDPQIKSKIRETWGDFVFSDGQVDRKALARIVFDLEKGVKELEKLERITHPEIGRRLQREMITIRNESVHSAVILDAPVMFKAGWDQFCDKILYVETELKIRQQRIADRGWDASELERRESFQLSLDLKRERATDVVDNSGTEQETFTLLKQLWKRWRLPLPSSFPSAP